MSQRRYPCALEIGIILCVQSAVRGASLPHTIPSAGKPRVPIAASRSRRVLLGLTTRFGQPLLLLDSSLDRSRRLKRWRRSGQQTRPGLLDAAFAPARFRQTPPSLVILEPFGTTFGRPVFSRSRAAKYSSSGCGSSEAIYAAPWFVAALCPRAFCEHFESSLSMRNSADFGSRDLISSFARQWLL